MKFNQEGKLILDNVTLIAVSSVKLDATLKALEHSLSLVEFAEVKLVTHEDIIHDKIKIEKCEEITSIKDYSKYMVYDLYKHIDTDFVVTIQHDGFVVNPNSWNDDFFNYDYIGAPWPNNFFEDENSIKIQNQDNFGESIRVGNGGFSFRSKRLLNIFNELNIDWSGAEKNEWHEDGFICMTHLKTLREKGVNFPEADVAYKFSREIECEDLDNTREPFGFHNYRDKNLNYPKFN